MKAYVLINARASKAREVVNKLQQIRGVRSAHTCWGRPDVFALVEVQNEKALAEIVLVKIQAIEGIEATDTHIVID